MSTNPAAHTHSAHDVALPCGRLDHTTGQPCQIRVVRPPITIKLVKRIDHLYGPRACPTHATDNDRALYEVLDRMWADAHVYGEIVGQRAGARMGKDRAVAEHIRAVRAGEARDRDDRGRQLITIEGGYTYYWPDHLGEGDLAIGDTVLLPPNQVNSAHHEAVVAGIGSTFVGSIKPVARLQTRAQQG